MFSNKKLLIFDLDGTLCDTLPDLTDSVNFALRKYELPTKSLEFVKNAIGNGVEILISRVIENGFDNPLYKDVFQTFRTHYLHNYKNKTVPYPNTKETLIKLKEKGYLLSVCTNKLHEAALEIIDQFFPNIFDFVLGSKPSLKKKPSPEMIEHILDSLKISKKDTLYIGDTNVDYEVATNSGVDYIIVSYGYRKKDLLIELDRRSVIVDRIEQLLNKF